MMQTGVSHAASRTHMQLNRTQRRVAACATRRDVLLGTTAGAALLTSPALAVQGLTPGRVPGVTQDPELEGFQVYKRPLGKSGGHGVGWSEIPQYSFRVPPGWEEIPVSIADLGGTEIDVRFRNKDEGDLLVVVAPVLRFREVGYNAQVTMEFLGDPDKIIAGFAPELYGKPLEDDAVEETRVKKKGPVKDQTYYEWDLLPHRLVSATATGNRVFLLCTTSNSRQWRKGGKNIKLVQESFYVEPVPNYAAVGF